MTELSRRNFLGWAGAAAVAGVAPGPIMALAELAAPPVAGAEMMWPVPVGWIRLSQPYGEQPIYNLPYWQVMPEHLDVHAGIERSEFMPHFKKRKRRKNA